MRLGQFAGASDPGRRRRRNEDSYVIDPPLFAVADGMGGAQAGEVASKLAAGAVKESGADVEELIQEANRRVHQRSIEDPNASGMGTTLTVASVENGMVSIGHVGDSRAYLVRDGRLEQVTEDHSLVGELMRSGKLSAEEAETHPQRSVITRALGTDPDVDVDMFPIETAPGDLFLICSDGLTTMVDDSTILALVEEHRGDLQALVKALIKAANRGGGEDNITVVAFDIADGDAVEQTTVAPAPCGGGRRPRRRGHADRGGRGPGRRHDGRERRRDRGRLRAAGDRASAQAPRSHARVLVPRRDRAPRGRRVPDPLGPRAVRLSARNRELLNLIVVGMLTGLGFASVYIARSEVVSPQSLTYAAFFLGLYLVAHVVTRICAPYADPYLLPMAGLLTAIGLTEIYRLNPDDAFRQGLWLVIGVALFSVTLIVLRHDYRRLESYKYVFGIGAIALLVLPALPGIGRTINGARLWVGVGPFQFQPGEFAKILLILFLAGYLREKREVLAQGRLKDFGPLLLIWGGAMAVLVQTNDLGWGLLYFGIFLAMLYVATARFVYVAGGHGALPRGRGVRLRGDPARPGPRDDLARPVAVRTGRGLPARAVALLDRVRRLRRHRPRQGHVHVLERHRPDHPVPQHRLHLLGARAGARARRVAAVVLVYMLFVARGFRAAMLAQDGFSKLLAAGLTFAFALQTFIIVGGVLRLIPLTGITLPFVCYGGSSLVANFVLLALLLLVSNRATGAARMNGPISTARGLRARRCSARSSSRRRTGRRGRRRGSPIARRTPSSESRSSRSSAGRSTAATARRCSRRTGSGR